MYQIWIWNLWKFLEPSLIFIFVCVRAESSVFVMWFSYLSNLFDSNWWETGPGRAEPAREQRPTRSRDRAERKVLLIKCSARQVRPQKVPATPAHHHGRRSPGSTAWTSPLVTWCSPTWRTTSTTSRDWSRSGWDCVLTRQNQTLPTYLSRYFIINIFRCLKAYQTFMFIWRWKTRRRTDIQTSFPTIITEFFSMPWSMDPTATTSTPPPWWTTTPGTLPTSSPRVPWPTPWRTSGRWCGSRAAWWLWCSQSKNLLIIIKVEERV